ncbi:MAG TPA: YiiX/YebB-like N1pC/P60 family cysteine hydrolase [Chitinophagaceae bacterium]|nr:YiiX/YebB-like N1pC/P60 family cysteine hydrolase [Chitinophagaceae bacterium]
MKRNSFFFLFLLFVFTSCKQTSKKEPGPGPEKIAGYYKQINSIEPLLHSGDMIFRNGNDEVSRASRSFNRKDTSFSHCGLVLKENDSLFVYHALGGSFNPSQKLMRQSLDSFCNPAENNAIGIYRYPLSIGQVDKLKETVLGYYKAGLRFDLYFNFKSDDKMYCAEFVFKSLNSAVEGALSPYVRLDTVPFGVTTDDLYLHPLSRLVKKASFY